jgi:hypothetical protein
MAIYHSMAKIQTTPLTTFLVAAFLQLLLTTVYTISVAPTWLPLPFIQSNTTLIYSNMAAASTINVLYTVPVNFAQAFSQIPRIAYGIRTMRCNYISIS